MPFYSVLPNGEEWRVAKFGRTISTQQEKDSAVKKAKEEARGHAGKSEVRVHRSDGTVQNVVTYE